MGGGMLNGIRKGKISLPGVDVDAEEISPQRLIVLGTVTTLSNPFWYAWWVTVAAGYLAEAQALGVASIAAFFLGHISADYAWDTLLSTVIGGGKNWISDPVYKGIILVCGIFFIYLGGMFMIQGGKTINIFLSESSAPPRVDLLGSVLVVFQILAI
jgi:threonine/homoserine/homoserine lactone efflux protein